jgi:hypothetical protein
MKTQNHNFQHFTGKKGGKSKRKHKVKVKQNHINKYPPYNHRELDQEFLPRAINTKGTEELEKALLELKDKGTIIIQIGEENGNS